MLAGLAGVAHWDSHQAHQEKVSGRDHATDGLWVLEQAEKLRQCSQGGTVLNTAFIEHLNGTSARTAGQLDTQISLWRSETTSA